MRSQRSIFLKIYFQIAIDCSKKNSYYLELTFSDPFIEIQDFTYKSYNGYRSLVTNLTFFDFFLVFSFLN